MVLLFSEHHSHVGVFDTSADAVQEVLGQAKDDQKVDQARVHGFTSLEKLAAAFRKGKGEESKDDRTMGEKVLPEALGKSCSEAVVIAKEATETVNQTNMGLGRTTTRQK